MYTDEVKKLNNYLKKQLWMDFELDNIDPGTVVLFGYWDELGETKIEIKFKEPHMISCNLLLKYEGKKDFIEIVEGEEARQINMKYGVIIGNNIFRIAGADIEADMFIVAKEIEVCIWDSDYQEE